MTTNICGILLAAGSASRFGDQKLLYPLSNGVKIVTSAARPLKQVLPRCVAVVTDHTNDVANILVNEGYELAINPNPHQGIGSSIQSGIRYASADAWVIALADMPFIQTHTISHIVEYLVDGYKIVAPSFNDRRGHPVGFNSEFKKQLLALHSDVGAKNILKDNKEILKIFRTNDPGVIQDIDTKKDLNTKGFKV